MLVPPAQNHDSSNDGVEDLFYLASDVGQKVLPIQLARELSPTETLQGFDPVSRSSQHNHDSSNVPGASDIHLPPVPRTSPVGVATKHENAYCMLCRVA